MEYTIESIQHLKAEMAKDGFYPCDNPQIVPVHNKHGIADGFAWFGFMRGSQLIAFEYDDFEAKSFMAMTGRTLPEVLQSALQSKAESIN